MPQVIQNLIYNITKFGIHVIVRVVEQLEILGSSTCGKYWKNLKFGFVKWEIKV